MVATDWCPLLRQVGSFYECAGIDAIILAEWCGLNFMGGPTVKAGLPLENVHVVLGQLRQRGLQIVSNDTIRWVDCICRQSPVCMMGNCIPPTVVTWH